MKLFYKAFILLFLIILGGCSSNNTKETVSEGYIEYSISYPGIDKSDVFAKMMLPSKMKLVFKDGKIQSELGTGSIFKTTIVADMATQSGFQLLKVVNKKYILNLDSIGIAENAKKIFDNITITPTEETKEIAGFISKKAIIKTATGKTFEIFYCPNIGSKNPNWFNPFKGIDGVLTEYKYKEYNIDMVFTAVKIVSEAIDTSIFVQPKGYEPISKEKMAEIFESF